MAEDVNVEHLLYVFASVNPSSNDIWIACIDFISLLNLHKPRQTVLSLKIEVLPNDHPSKHKFLSVLLDLSQLVGNLIEKIRLLNHLLKLERERGNDRGVADTLGRLSEASQLLSRPKEGIYQAREALEIYERLGDTFPRAGCLSLLARSLCDDGQLDAAEEAAICSNELLLKIRGVHMTSYSQLTLGDIYLSKGQKERAIYHLKMALRIASFLNWKSHLFLVHLSMAEYFLSEDEFNDGYVHIKQAKLYAADAPYDLATAALLQSRILYRQQRLEDAVSESLDALEIFQKVGALHRLASCRALLRDIERARKVELPSASQIPTVSLEAV